MKQHMRGSLKTEGIGLVVRNAHAKGYGLARENLKSSVDCLTNMRRNLQETGTPRSHGSIFKGTTHVGGDRFLGRSPASG